MKWSIALVTAITLLSGCTTISPAGSSDPCRATPQQNRAIVEAFFQQALVERDPGAAFARFAAADFIEHKPDVPDGTSAATARYLGQLIEEMPEARWELLRSVAEDDMVVLHVRFVPAPGAPPYAIADLFRLSDCQIVEHWDVVAGPPAVQLNPNPRF